jgi:5'-nucleotidase / UDP-sugar diphosphatase
MTTIGRATISLYLALILWLPATADVQSASALSSVGCQTQEVELGDLVADSIRNAGQTPIAFLPAGSLKEITIPAGSVKTDDVLECLQYPDDKIAVIELTGDQIARALERSVSIYPQKNMGFLQVSGLSFVFDPQSPKGYRVGSVIVGKDKLIADSKYRVATTQPLADGAYGYFTVWGKNHPSELKEKTVSQAVTEFLSARDSVDYGSKNRIRIKE